MAEDEKSESFLETIQLSTEKDLSGFKKNYIVL